MANQTAKTRKLTQLALLIAIEGVLFVTPLGLITIPPVSITTMHIPVIIAGILLGPVSGAVVGGAFGLMALAKATLASVSPVDMMFSPFLSGSPIASVVMCVGARIALGVISAYLYIGICKILKKKAIAVGVCAAIATVCHTIMVLACLSLFFSALPLKAVFMTIITLNGSLEILSAVVIAVAVVIPLEKTAKLIK